MKLIIAGSRTLNPNTAIINSLLGMFKLYTITEVISGTARGVDRSGETFAHLCNTEIKRFPANWDEHGKGAGYIRNKQMADYADALLLIWDGESKGSANMKQNMEKLGKPVYEVILKGA